MKKIIFPTDFSREAVQALPIASQLARQLAATLHLIHVLPPTPAGFSPFLLDADTQYLQTMGEVEQLFDAVLQLPCLQNLMVQTHVVFGSDPTDLLEDARFADADLLIVASTGASGWKEVLTGSNAEHLIRRARMPILVLKNPSPYLSVKTIVFASDFEGHYDTSVDLVQTLLDGFDYPTVHLLFVNTLSHFIPSSKIKPRMETFAARYCLGGSILNQLDEFDVEAALLAFAREKKADLIVLGTHGWRGLRHLLQGSLAEDVANHAPIPVLILPLRWQPKTKVESDTDTSIIQPES
ncbi:universal stress protein [Spirosoma aureum]|uniref:Universal stress protein n=1 Tax=Spirosoma aureum TaxID=2692134 RepID=A0A6G9ASF1_9BACT|nr:universal stress protein [Spirosoma aureum]QIP15143.1 universal stress protein [Spirosoma aureum]